MLVFFFSPSSSARQIPREAEAGDGFSLPSSRLGSGDAGEHLLLGPCAGLVQGVATHNVLISLYVSSPQLALML